MTATAVNGCVRNIIVGSIVGSQYIMGIHKLNAAKVKSAPQGKYYDGGGLLLVVTKTLGRSWVLRYTLHGKRLDMGLGGLKNVSLAEARVKAKKFTTLASQGIDPKQSRDTENIIPPTFAECASTLIESKRKEWKNAKHALQWVSTLETYANTKIGNMPIDRVTTYDVLSCLKPIWTIRTETASRVRSRIEGVIDFGIAHGYREGPNPARWRGHLDKLLPSPKKIAKPVHQPAMLLNQIADFYNDLQSTDSMSALALQFLILTATRTSETLNAEWVEIVDDTWTIPAARMKAGKAHRVPLTPEALKILERLGPVGGQYIFTGNNDKPLSNMAMLQLMRRKGFGRNGKNGNAVPHGFRASFRDWSSEHTEYARDACEMALAHTVVDKTEAAYRRGDMLDKRRNLMSDWAHFVTKKKPLKTVIAA